jgi:hypothetical protein
MKVLLRGVVCLSLVQAELLMLMERDTLPRFRASKAFARYLEQEPVLFRPEHTSTRSLLAAWRAAMSMGLRWVRGMAGRKAAARSSSAIGDRTLDLGLTAMLMGRLGSSGKGGRGGRAGALEEGRRKPPVIVPAPQPQR